MAARGWTIVREINNSSLAGRQAVFSFPPATSLIIGQRDLYANMNVTHTERGKESNAKRKEEKKIAKWERESRLYKNISRSYGPPISRYKSPRYFYFQVQISHALPRVRRKIKKKNRERKKHTETRRYIGRDIIGVPFRLAATCSPATFNDAVVPLVPRHIRRFAARSSRDLRPSSSVFAREDAYRARRALRRGQEERKKKERK